MSTKAYSVEVSVDESTGQLQAAYFHIRQGEVARTKEIEAGIVLADYDEQGQLVGVELLGPCSAQVLDAITETEPAAIQQFLRQSVPAGWLDPIESQRASTRIGKSPAGG